MEVFLGGPMAETSPPKAGGVDSIPRQGAKILHTSWSKTLKYKNRNTVTNSIKI